MRKIVKRSLLIISIILILFILMSLFSYYVYPLWRFYPEEPEFEAGLEWISEDGNIYVNSVEDDDKTVSLYGYIRIDDEKIDVSYCTRAGTFIALRFSDDYSYTSGVFYVDYKIDRKGNIILKNVEHSTLSDLYGKENCSNKIILKKK